MLSLGHLPISRLALVTGVSWGTPNGSSLMETILAEWGVLRAHLLLSFLGRGVVMALRFEDNLIGCQLYPSEAQMQTETQKDMRSAHLQGCASVFCQQTVAGHIPANHPCDVLT